MKHVLPPLSTLQGAFEPWMMEGEIHDLVVTGSIPPDLKGTFFRNGPNPQFVHSEKYHLFDGDGMVHAFEFSEKRIRYFNKWVRTEKFALEREAGRSLFGGILNRWKDPSVEGRSGSPANTHVVWHGGKLLALYEGGLPIELDPVTLETIGPWTFGGCLDRPMTAHPKIDPRTGELLFFSRVFGSFNGLVYYCANAKGEITETREIQTPFQSVMHDFAITDNYIIFPVFPLTFNLERAMRGEAPITWEPWLGTRFGIVSRRQKSSEVTWIQTDACFAFHFMNAFEETPDGLIVVDAIAVDPIPDDAKPFQGEEDDYPTRLIRWTLDLREGSAKKSILDSTRGEMPRIDERFAGRSYRHGYFVAQLDDSKPGNWWNAIVHFDLKDKTRRIYSVPDGDILNEAILVPKTEGDEGEGYLLSLVYRHRTDRSELLVHDAQKIDRGPLATVLLPHRVPFGFHGCWKPET